jgi:hypothetical protein
MPVNLAHVVMQQHVRGAGRTRTEERADDAAGRLRALERIELEPLIEQVGGRLRDELGDAIQLLLGQALRVLAELEQAEQVARTQRRGIRRHHADDRFDRLGSAGHHARVFVVGFGVARRVPVNFLAREIVIVPASQIVAVLERRDRARQRQDLQTVLRQFEIADDLRPQQTHDIREFREAIAGKDFLGHRRAADDFAPLEHDDLLARARQVRSGNQAVMARADDDRVVLITAHSLSLLDLPFFRTLEKCSNRHLRPSASLVPS